MKYPYQYDPKKRRIAKVYTRIRVINSVLNGILLPLLFFYVFLSIGFNTALKTAFPEVLAYTFIFITLLNAVQFPLRFYSGFTLEHRYGLSHQSIGAWLKDYLKTLLLGYVFLLPVVAGLYALLPMENWWLYGGIGYSILVLLLNYIFPVIIFPFFYKVVPYTDKKMKQKLIAMAARYGKRIDNVLVAKESEKSVKANAMFSGIGSTKRIILYDNLLKYFTKGEVETVIGHELGHYVNKDVIRFFIIDAVRIFPVLYAMDFILKSSIGSFGITAMNDVASLALVLLAYNIIELILMPAINTYSRYIESKADLFGLEATGLAKAQESTERRLADNDLVDDHPNEMVELLLFSHPAPWRRVKMCREWRRK